MNILNLYAGIGGNRKLWGNEHNITAIELNPDIAKIYKDFYPNDKVIITDAHQYLLDHFKEYDFIWSSPPCPTHSILNTSITEKENKFNKLKYRYPDMTLYQEIILLTHFAKKNKWVVENVRPYYKPLIYSYIYIDRHLFWSNFIIKPIEVKKAKLTIKYQDAKIRFGTDISNRKEKIDKRKVLRNMVNPEIGKYIFECSKLHQGELF